MPYIDPSQMPPQKGPKSPRAVQAEANQARAALEEARPKGGIVSRGTGGVRNQFLKSISIFKWKVSPEEVAKKLTKMGE